jgi:hypothetical protein
LRIGVRSSLRIARAEWNLRGDSDEKRQLTDLLLQSLEHEMGGVKIYENAVRCAVHPDLQREWRA